ncbi:UDP-glycosyltransferase [Quillaja saponaria]|uniref:Glycosyltransferase n=1 Tax=Quillaja saponaria TaxID=32244 RepID=A0AAD7PC22_QUISA|nr:UDP-glycosyltransferase [Quillaja saponaria]
MADQVINSNKKLHVVLLPWLAFGHMIPFLELAKLIAQKGHKISYISTPRNIQRLPKIPSHLSNNNLNFVEFSLPHIPNLPQNVESTNDVTHYNPIAYYLLIKALEGLQQPVTTFLETSDPDWIIHDVFPQWLTGTAARLGISHAFYTTSSALRTASNYSPLMSSELPQDTATDFTIKSTNLLAAKVLIIRSCLELEPNEFEQCKNLCVSKTVIPLGVVPPSIQVSDNVSNINDDDDDKDKDKDNDWVKIVEWLNHGKEKGSVVYVALGSEVSLSQQDLNEFALGLDLSGLSFFWVFRNAESYELPAGFEDRVKGRGIVWISWAPQVRILGHVSIGGFFSHGGWSSVIESLSFGIPLVVFPFGADQGINAKQLEGKNAGVEIPRSEGTGSFTRKSVADLLRLVVVEEGKVYRDGAKNLMKLFGDKDLNYKYIDNFVKYMEEHAAN